MVYCNNCAYFEHRAGIGVHGPYEFFLCRHRERTLDKRFVDQDLHCHDYVPKIAHCDGNCDTCQFIGSCSDVGY